MQLHCIVLSGGQKGSPGLPLSVSPKYGFGKEFPRIIRALWMGGLARPSQGRDLHSLREEARGTQSGVPEGAAGPTATTATGVGRLALIWGVGRRGRDTDDGSHEVPAVAVQVKAVMRLGIEA